ncbi:hypothetical protein A5636_07365 [Mycobacterium asiaticum]|uniref:Uncharacterized protein n=1 Tax=Mycobacterium asiaticum TaxID=1790 RepID=A0A1A3N0Q0_MYCAS|nr:hypothetical protein A5636_07365 [Mycobacterium asiaticum]
MIQLHATDHHQRRREHFLGSARGGTVIHNGIVAFFQTDLAEELENVALPVPVRHSQQELLRS